MTIKDTKKLEEKMDLLINELKMAELGRKRDKVFSKIDSFYNILIALSTFVVGVIITQHQNLTSPVSVGVLFSMVGVVLSLLYSYYVGFKGMIKDCMHAWSRPENREMLMRQELKTDLESFLVETLVSTMLKIP